MKYKEQVQAITTINEFLRFHTNPSKTNTSNGRQIRRNMRRCIIRIYGRHTFLMALFSVKWMISSIKLFKVVAKVENLSLFSGATAVQSRPKSQSYSYCKFIRVCPPAKMAVKNRGRVYWRWSLANKFVLNAVNSERAIQRKLSHII